METATRKRQINRLCDRTEKQLFDEFVAATATLNAARGPKRRERASRLREESRTRLLVCRAIDGRYFRPVAKKVRSIVNRLTDLIIDTDGSVAQINRAIEQSDSEILETVRQSLEQVARDQLKERGRDLWPRLDAPQLREITNLPFDQYGNVKPESKIPPKILDPNLPLVDILEHMSPLLFIDGDSYMNDQVDVLKETFNQVEPRDLVERYDATDRKISSPYREKLGDVSAGINIGSFIRAGERVKAARAVRDAYYGIDESDGGIVGRIRNEIRHDSLRIVKHSKEETLNLLGDVVVGYTLYSRFLSTTDPEHAANSGNCYFKDDRAGRADLWANRLVPPYRKNCVCFTLEKLESPTGQLRAADFRTASLSGGRKITEADVGAEIWDHNKGFDSLGRRVGGFRKITEDDVGTTIRGGDRVNVLSPRDVGDMRTWFNQQFPGVRRTLFGPRRFEAVQEKARRRGEERYRPRYEDFVDPVGNVLTARQLERETKNRRAVRVRGVKRIIDQLTENHHKAWEAGDGRYSLDPVQEARFKSVLQRWLVNLPKQSRR